MDETTPHIHATVVPIVRGERRKAKQEQAKNAANGKKSYRKKKDGPRLCADDVMARPKLKAYQTSYADTMAKYGLKRGIEGSEAKHITGSQFYREVFVRKNEIARQVENLKEQQQTLSVDVTALKAQQADAQADYHTIDEQRRKKRQELEQVKHELAKTQVKQKAATATETVLDGIVSLFDDSKLKKSEREIDALKQENTTLQKEIETQKSTLERMKDESDKVMRGLRNEIAHLHELMSELKGLLQVEKICQAVGFGTELTTRIMRGESVGFKGSLYSPEHKKWLHTDHSTAKSEQDPQEKGRMRLTVDGIDVFGWLKRKHQEQYPRPQVKEPLRQPIRRGIKR